MEGAWQRLLQRARALLARLPFVRAGKKRERTPTILQMEAVECGAAALAIILAHFDRWVALEELRQACDVSRDGSKASNVIKAARRYGLQAKGFKTTPQGLRTLPLPMIIHWNFNHFLVLEGFDGKGTVFLNDPAYGPRKVTEEELDESFTGVTLTFEPGEDFEAEGSPPRLLPALRRRLVGSEGGLTFVVLTGLVLVVPALTVPIFTKVFLDRVLLAGHLSWLRPLLLGLGLVAVLLGLLTALQQTYLLRLETRMAVAGSGRFFWHVLRLPIDFFNQRFAGDIAMRVGVNDRVASLLSRDLASNFLDAVLIVFFALVMLQYDVGLTLAGVAIVALNVLALRLVARHRVDGSRRMLQEKGKLHGTAVGGLGMIETLKATGGEAAFFSRWAGYQAKVVNARQRLELTTQVLEAVPPLLAALNTALILGLGSLRVMGGVLTIGALLAFQGFMTRFTQPIQRLVTLGGKLQTVEGDMARLDDVLRYPVEARLASLARGEEREEEPVGAKLSGRLTLRGVTFGYSRLSPPLIEGFDLDLEPGRRVALVGGSGSGKSTLARLIVGLHEPWRGEILFDGRPRSEWSAGVLNASVGFVDQDVFLFAGSVRENLTLWDATVPLPEVVAAARDATIHHDIASRPGGYESPVTEGGSNWSGGQRQRLELARSLVGEPRLLILDEATSALDSTTEEEIDANLRRRGLTCLIVAHRLSTIRDADEIIVMEKGKVVERGNHQQLMAAGGAYAELIRHG